MENKFVWDFYSGAPKYHGKLDMVCRYFTKFNFLFMCFQQME